MRKEVCIWIAVFCLGLSSTSPMCGQSPDASIAGGSVPHLISFSGAEKDASGQPLRGEVTLIFSLYSFPDGGSPLWVESQKLQLDEQGHYTVVLGATSPSGLPLDLFLNGKALWLGVQPELSAEPEQARVLLVAVPYALKAADADTLGGKPASAYLTVESESSSPSGATADSVPPSQAGAASKPTARTARTTKQTSCLVDSDGGAIDSSIPLFTANGCTIESSSVFQSGSNVGIGTITPAANLEVNGTAQFDGPIALNSSSVGLTSSFGNTGNIYYLDQITPAGVPGAGPFTVNYHTATFNGTPDPAIGIGYNQSLSGNQIVPNEPGISLNMESNYNDGTGDVMEIYWQYVSSDNSKRIRPFYFNVDRGTNATEMWLQKDGGNVAIDTTAPNATLDVEGVNYSPPAANPGISGTPGLRVTSQNGGPALSGSNSGGDGGLIYLSSGSGGTSTGMAPNSNGGDISFQVGSAGTGGSGGSGRPGYLLLNPHGGKVGIGTLTPVASLDVENGATVLNGGNVGIGTSTPAATLEVNGTTKFDQVVTFTTGQVFPGTIAGVTAGADLTGGGTGGQVTLNLDTTKVPTLAAGSNTFAGVGSFNRVGIGTTSPVGALQVTDTSQLGTIIGDLNPSHLSGGLYVQGAYDGGIGGIVQFARSNANSIPSNTAAFAKLGYYVQGSSGFIGVGSSDNFQVITGLANAGTSPNNGGGNVRLTVLNGGNVGIGTTNPSATLEVNGTAKFDQGLAGTAANFSGDVSIGGSLSVGGTISKGGGSFRIDHPLDPGNKYLSHSFVESPDMMNIYNGNVVTNDKGEAEVVLPDYFDALNREFRYQLTVIGQFAQAIVASKIENNRFTILTDKPRVEVSWQVTGVRHDAWANAHRIVVEEEKKPEDRSHYLAPELFAEPAGQ